MFLWPAPLAPAGVTIGPELADQAATDTDPALSVQVAAADVLLDALATRYELPRERALSTLSALGLACWSAHQVDERGDVDDDEDEDDTDDE